MRLLIVDDQLDVAHGIAREINWGGIGIDQVVVAGNAIEARLSVKDSVPDVILLDIEMPMESGMEFLEWLKREHYQSKVIFLTCHQEFAYAAEALRLGAINYILQPAPYHKIKEAVLVAIADLLVETDQKRKAQLFDENIYNLQSDQWSRYLRGDREIMNTLVGGELSWGNVETCLVLVEIEYWKSIRDDLQGKNMCHAIRNIMADIFDLQRFSGVVSYIQRDIYSIVIQERAGASGSLKESASKRVEYLEMSLQENLPCQFRCFWTAASDTLKLPDQWEAIVKSRTRPAASDIIPTEQKGETGAAMVLEQIKDYIKKHVEEELMVEELAAQMHFNPDYLNKLFKKDTGINLKSYMIQEKMRHAQTLLRNTSLPVGVVAARVGYSNFSHFSNTYKKETGRSPSEERK